MKKILSILLTGLLLCSSVGLVACSNETAEVTTTAATTPSNEEQPTPVNSLAEYKIIRSDSADRNSLDRTSSLQMRDSILSVTGIELQRSTDAVDYTVDEEVF